MDLPKQKTHVKHHDIESLAQAIQSTINSFAADYPREEIIEIALRIIMVDALGCANDYKTLENDCKEFFAKIQCQSLKMYNEALIVLKKMRQEDK
jgi:predicted transposase YbfD/YdcC